MRFFFLTVSLCSLFTLQGFAGFSLTWGLPAISLHSDPPVGERDQGVKIKIDSNGNAVAVWGRTVGGGASEEIWASVFNHTSRVWSSAVRISGGGSASRVDLVMDGQGNSFIVWEEGFPSQIVMRSLKRDGVWSPRLDSEPAPVMAASRDQFSPEIHIENERGLVVLWRERFSNSYHVFSAKKAFGEELFTKIGKISPGTRLIRFPQKKNSFFNEIGRGAVVWEGFGKNLEIPIIFASIYENGFWGAPITVSSPEKGSHSPSVVVDKKGRAVIAWVQEGKVVSKDLTKQGPSSLSSISNPSFAADHPFLAVDGQGDVVMVFERYDQPLDQEPTTKFIMGARRKFNSSIWAPPVEISGPSREPLLSPASGYPIVALNRIGDGAVIWKEFNGEKFVVQGAGYSLGAWSLFKTLSNEEENEASCFASYDMDITLNESGNIIAVWPEDVNGVGAPQVKAVFGVGLAINNPHPPFIKAEEIGVEVGVIYGKQILRKFPAHADIVNILSWSSHGNVHHYNVYRNNTLNYIGSTVEPYFEDHQRPPHQRESYLVTCVDENEQESVPMTVFVEPLKKLKK